MTEIEVQNERVDDIPLLIGQVQKMGLAEVIDTIVIPHWRQQGLSVGRTIMTWYDLHLVGIGPPVELCRAMGGHAPGDAEALAQSRLDGAGFQR